MNITDNEQYNEHVLNTLLSSMCQIALDVAMSH